MKLIDKPSNCTLFENRLVRISSPYQIIVCIFKTRVSLRILKIAML